MGCDIHFFVERYSKDTDYSGPRLMETLRDEKISIIQDTEIEEKWISCDDWYIDEEEDDDVYWTTEYDRLFYKGRNYDLFSKLADVRSYGDYTAISEPRGIPIQPSDGYKYMCRQWNGDAHSHSYFTLTELLNEDFSDFPNFQNTIERMKGIDSDTDKVRCVFFFDN